MLLLLLIIAVVASAAWTALAIFGAGMSDNPATRPDWELIAAPWAMTVLIAIAWWIA